MHQPDIDGERLGENCLIIPGCTGNGVVLTITGVKKQALPETFGSTYKLAISNNNFTLRRDDSAVNLLVQFVWQMEEK